jgi:ribosomal protein S18 acetylase RimI-like enzyme
LVEAVSGSDVALQVGVPAVNVKAQGLLEKLGFQLTGKSVRMVLGSVERGRDDATHVYGIGGPEKG